MRSGFTIPELVIGLAFLAMVGVVLARMMLGLVKSSQYTLRQTAALTAARRGIDFSGKQHGLLWMAQEASSVRSLSSGTLQLNMPDASLVDYLVSNGDLMRKLNGIGARQAVGISSLTVTYYGVDSSGLVCESTSPNTASLVHFTLSAVGKGTQRSYSVAAAAWLRNR